MDKWMGPGISASGGKLRGRGTLRGPWGDVDRHHCPFLSDTPHDIAVQGQTLPGQPLCAPLSTGPWGWRREQRDAGAAFRTQGGEGEVKGERVRCLWDTGSSVRTAQGAVGVLHPALPGRS